MVALDGQKVIGAGSIRNLNHISLLFVEDGYHRMAVGSANLTAVCDYKKQEAGEK